jgi:ribonuclease HII
VGAVADALVAFDRSRSGAGRLVLAGVDEAGRGSWAGPVVAAAVVLPDGWGPPGLDDSKKLTPGRREVLCREIRASALCWGACAVSARQIDAVGILPATFAAMARAVAGLGLKPDLVLVDGDRLPVLPVPAETLVRGDGTSAAVAAASVLAKVFRDRIMTAWDRHHPGYGFADHKGYGAPAHRAALRRLGPSPQHRRTYRPLAQLDQGDLF